MIEPLDSRESRLRSVLKAITCRITGTATAMGLTSAVAGIPVTAPAIGGVESGAKPVICYAHESAWQKVPIGGIRRLTHYRHRG